MFERVLVPTDFSDHAKKTIRCLTRIPGIGHVILLHVVDATHHSKRGWTHEPAIDHARIVLQEEEKWLRDAGFSVSTKLEVITSGDIPRTILEVGRREKVTTIMMGSRGRSLIKGIFLGSVSSGVLRWGSPHLLIMRDALSSTLNGEKITRFCDNVLTRLLFPTDFSEPAHKALQVLQGLEGIGEIILFHVVTRGETKKEIAEEVAEATKKLEAVRDDLLMAGIKSQIRVRLGRSIDEIIHIAEEEDVTLITLSAHGKGLFEELLIGSTTHGVAIHALRPVLVIRTQKHKKQE